VHVNKLEIPAPEALGSFEQLLLTSIMMLGGETYGVPIYDKVCELAEKRINLGSMYLTLDRMEEKGLLASWRSEGASEPRGRSKRYYRIEASGLRALEETLENAKRLSAIFDDNSGGIRRWLKQRARLARRDT
jgi:PadR family transcriptional regulator, regulatory protein PadR